ncbi:MAG: hypothetical protein KDD40_07915 [Bdellovibrionales bacterium]|nr:hypothetical protein [Bdellovibrionales bacterium]
MSEAQNHLPSESQPHPVPTNTRELMTAKATWSCELTSREEKNTVGAMQDLHCSGDAVSDLNLEKVQIVFAEKDKDYSLYILNKKHIDSQSLNFVVTSYKAGKFDNPLFIITDGEQAIKVDSLSWNVESVLKSQQEQPEPSFGPFELSMPWWYWTSLWGAILLVFFIVLFKIKKLWDRKKLIEELSTHATALTPFNQFNKDLRTQVKDWQQKELTEKVRNEEEWRRNLLEATEKSLRQYLMRELLIPTLEWADSEILREIKKRHPKVFNEASLEIKKTLLEIQQAKKAKNKITYLDCEQLVNMTRNLSEKIHEIKQGSKK